MVMPYFLLGYILKPFISFNCSESKGYTILSIEDDIISLEVGSEESCLYVSPLSIDGPRFSWPNMKWQYIFNTKETTVLILYQNNLIEWTIE